MRTPCLTVAFALLLTACSPPPTAGIASDDSDTTTTQNAAVAPAKELAEPKTDRSGQVLRHAVFFAFKDTSSEQDIQEVADAFRALPSKIDAIIDFGWGKNNSPEGLDDGFTHCFLLTFKDEAGRAEYLPHEEHKAFGDVLRPHMEKVFVIDYWGTPDEQPEKQLKHAVFFKFKDDAPAAEVKAVEEAFAALPGEIDAIKAFEWGKNNSPEKHDHGFTHCFMVTFGSEQGRADYLPHEAHQAFVAKLEPVLDKVRVLDFWAEK